MTTKIISKASRVPLCLFLLFFQSHWMPNWQQQRQQISKNFVSHLT